MQSASSSSIEESKSVKERSFKTPAKGAEGKDSDIVQSYEQLPIPDSSLLEVSSGYDSESGVSENDEDQSREMSSAENGEAECWYKFLRRKIGLDINARQLIETNPELAKINKSELMIRLAYELCLAKNTEYNPENDAAKNEEENNKHRRFDTSRIFALFKVLNEVIEKPDRRRFVEFVCQKGNVQLLEMICQQENKDGGGKAFIYLKYSWKGEFTGYERLTDLLQYVLKQPCSSEIVLCIAKKVYGRAHVFCNGEQYFDSKQIANIKVNFDYQSSVIEDCLKAAIELGYKNVVQVMLGGDIYHCIRLIKDKKFQEEKRFSEALGMVEEAVVEVMSSLVNCKQDLSKEVKGLLKEGIEVEINKVGRKYLIDVLECQGEKVKDKKNITKKALIGMLKRTVGEEGVRVRLSKTVVGGLISTLFFNYQDKLMEEPFELEIICQDLSRRKAEMNELNEKIGNREFVKERILKLIQSLNSSSHVKSNWFFREVLVAIVNDEGRSNKLKAVCAAICKEPMQRLLEGKEVHIDVLKFFGVEISSSQITTSEIPESSASIDDHFAEDIQKLAEKIKEEGKIEIDKETSEPKESDRLAFSGLSRNIIIELKKKSRLKEGLTDEEKDSLSNAVSQVMREIKEGINILASSTDVGDIFEHFEVINSEIEKEDKREIVELVCQSGNAELLEKICQQENKDGGGKAFIHLKYSWKGDFTGYEKLIDLLQYVLKQPCPPKIVLCIAKKVYGNAHIFCNGEQYFDSKQIANIKVNFDYQSSVIEDCLKAVIELGYKNVVQVMLGGDIYRCIRLMKDKKFQEGKKALKMIEETVAEVISSWVRDERQSFKDDVQRLLKEGVDIDIKVMKMKDLIDELESREIKLSDKEKKISKKGLLERLKKEVGRDTVRLRLRKIVVGGLVSTLFFNYQMEKPFKLGVSQRNEERREKEIDELNKEIDSKSFVKEKVLEKIRLLNSSSHIFNSWFFREVLAAIVNDEGKFNKLQAVCVAICKEPMERLLRGAEVHEDVVDTLKFFGVDSLALEKSNVVANIPLLRISPPDSPGSKAAKKNNKYLMQNNYRRDGEFYYNAGTGSYLNSQNSPRGVGMLDSKSLNEKLSRLSLRGEDSELIIPNLPEIDHLMKVHGAGYKQRLLDKVLDCDSIVIHPALQEGSSEGVSGTLGNSMNQSRQLDFSRLSDAELAAIKTYREGVALLKLGREKDGKEEFKKAADRGFSHAGYVYAIMTFKEIVQHHIDNQSKLPTKKDINKAVQCMINVKKEFFPFPSFVLGMMQSYNQIVVNKKLAAQVTSARECFDDVLSGVRYSEGNYSLTVPRKYITVGDESEEYLKWVVQSTKYELARGILSRPEDSSDARSLLQELSSGDFVDAKYLYALALLKDTFGDAQKFEKENFGQACILLEEAINHGYKEAMFFFGTLPFRQEFKILGKESQSDKGRCCFGYLREYIETCGKDGKFKKDAAILIAAEYVKEKSSYVTYNEERAKNVLRENDCLDKLQELERKLQERANSVLPNVLGELEQVHSKLKKNIEPSAQQLSSKVKELLDALQGSGLIVQQSPLLPPTLELLRISSTKEQRALIAPLEQLCYVLELQVDSQSHKEVLSSLQSLFSTCVKLQMGHIPSQDLNPNKPSTTLQMERSSSISPVLSISKQGFNPKSSSTMKGDEGVAGDSVFDATLDDKSTFNSNKSLTFLEREQKRRDRKSEERKGNSGLYSP